MGAEQFETSSCVKPRDAAMEDASDGTIVGEMRRRVLDGAFGVAAVVK